MRERKTKCNSENWKTRLLYRKLNKMAKKYKVEKEKGTKREKKGKREISTPKVLC